MFEIDFQQLLIGFAGMAALVLALGVAVITFKGEMKKIPAFSSPLFKCSMILMLAVISFAINQYLLAVIFFIISAVVALKINGFNLRGLMLSIKILPHLITKNHQRILAICDEAMHGDTRAPMLFAIGASSAIELQNFEKCRDYSQRIVLLIPEKANGYYLRGIAESKLMNFYQALKAFNKAISLDNANADAYKLERAQTYFSLQNFENALQDIKDFSSSPLYLGVHKLYADSLRANCLSILGENNEALSTIEKVIETSADLVSAENYNHFVTQKIEILTSLGNWQQLIEFSTIALQSAPLESWYTHRALAYSAIKNIENAEQDLDAFIASEFWKPITISVRAYISLQKELVDQSLNLAKQAYESNSSTRLIRLIYAYALIKGEKFLEAKQVTASFLSDYPKIGDGYQLLSSIYKGLGETDKSLESKNLAEQYGQSTLFH